MAPRREPRRGAARGGSARAKSAEEAGWEARDGHPDGRLDGVAPIAAGEAVASATASYGPTPGEGSDGAMRHLDLVEDVFALPGEQVRTFRPRDAEALLDERAFVEEDEFLPYWAELWPAAEGLARALAPRRLDGRAVLELGCGIALPSVVAAMRGARVLATDWSVDALPVVQHNATANGVRVETARVAWDAPDLVVDRGPWPLVLASDVLYERRMVDLLLALLPRLVAPGGEILIADSGRPLAPLFLEEAAARFAVDSRRDQVLERVAVHRLRPRGAGAATR